MKKDFNYYTNLYGGDKGDNPICGNHYANYYEPFFKPIQEKVTNICEIGVQKGASVKTFQDYFPNAQIIGLDIGDKSQFNTSRITTQILNQSKPDQLENFVTQCEKSNIKFDIILDDGSHDIEHQQLTFGKFFKLLKPKGIYVLEDLGTSFMEVDGVSNVYGNYQTQEKLKNSTLGFLFNRPFSSPWINEVDLQYINQNVSYISTFDKLNELPYIHPPIKCINNIPLRAITSIIQKK